MRKDFHVHAEMQSCADTEWNMSIMGLVCSCPIYLKADVLESCARFSPFRGVCPVVEQTGLGLLCLSERGGIPRMCVGAVMR